MERRRVYIETHGCQMNVADTERAATRLRAAGYELTDRPEEADVVLLNTCSVREKAEQKVYTRVGEVRRLARRPLVGVMGCVAQLEGEALFERAPGIRLVVGTRATDRLPVLIERAQTARRAVDLGDRQEGERWDVSPVERHSPYVAFVPIIEGCNKFCSYCIVPFSRGRERSRAAREIIAEVERLGELGYREVHMLGQNVNSWRPRTESERAGLESFAGATPFSRLLRAVAATGMRRIKFTTSFPRDFHPDIVTAIDEHENLCNWVHLPVQAGSDRILRLMRRGYTRRDYMERVAAIRRARRPIALTSDIIIGFPTETRAEFEETLSLVRECEFDGLYIFKYSERPGTRAASMADDVSPEEKRERFLQLEEVQREIQRRRLGALVGQELEVLVEGTSAKSAEHLTGHSTCNRVVSFAGDGRLCGRIVRVRITEAKEHSLWGEVVAEVA